MSQSFISNKSSSWMQSRRIEQYIGRALRNMRVNSGLRMIDLARVAGTSYQQIYKIEMGINRLTLSRFHIFMKYLGVSPRSFYEMVFETDWEKGMRLENPLNTEFLAIIYELSEEERAVIFDVITIIRRAGKKRRIDRKHKE